MARRPDEWIAAARPLRVGAYALRDHQQSPGTAGVLFTSLFLAALALENVLKAVVVVRVPDIVKEGGLKFGGSAHKLSELADKGSFTLSDDERKFLDVSASPCITDFGRYRIPMSVAKAKESPGHFHFHSGGFKHFESIFNRAVETALREWCAGAADHRSAIASRLHEGIRLDKENC